MLFILATTLGGGLSAFAAPGAKPNKGDLTIHKHWAETPADIGSEGTGETWNPGVNNPPIKGIKFDVYEVKPQGNAPATPPSDKDGWTYSRTGNELTVSKGAESHKYDLTLKASDASDGKTDINGELKYSDLDAGYYYVEEDLSGSDGYEVQGTGNAGKKITSGVKPFIVAVPMTNADGTDWNDDVHVYPKNQGLNPEKKPDKPSVIVGDKVKWSITANLPQDFADYTVFTVTDELDKRLNFVDTPAPGVVVTGIDAVPAVKVTLDYPADYTVTHTPAASPNKEKIVIALTAAGIEKLAKTDGVVKIAIDFETTVNGNINNGDDDENKIENKADIEFENSTQPDGKIETDTSEIHTGEIKIEKTYTGGTSSISQSAQFQLAASETAAKAGQYYRVILDPTDSHIVRIVPYGDPEYGNAKKWVAIPSYAVKGEALGLVGDTFYVQSFEGLQTYTEDAQGVKTYNKYYLVETLAPDKYNLLDGPVEVTFETANTQHVETKEIENKRGFTLPNTGGAGTLLMVVVGIILIGLAILLTTNKRKTA
ncbi:fimbrial isopeptide formation D2 domain-containing protein [Enterococcus pallens]|nr:fimbrial isopeptide formation D2 domain-containing protein [Enterococcus pallens]